MKLSIALATALSCTIPVASATPAIHLIMIGNTDDRSIGDGVKGNLNGIHAWVTAAATALRIDLHETVTAGPAFKCAAFEHIGEAGSIGADDVVIFYYAGHGYRRHADVTPFPRFLCGQLPPGDDLASLESVAARLASTHARLVVAISDSCNRVIAEPNAPLPTLNFDQPGDPSREVAYRNLLLLPHGRLVMSSSISDQSSWYGPNRGLFTTQLLESLQKYTSNGEAGRWDDVLGSALKQIHVPMGTRAGKPIFLEQDPQADQSKLKVQ